MCLNVKTFFYITLLAIFSPYALFADSEYKFPEQQMTIIFSDGEIVDFGNKIQQVSATLSLTTNESILLDKYYPDAGGYLEALKPLFINIDSNIGKELVIVTRENIHTDESLKQEGYFYNVHIYKDIDKRKPVQLNAKSNLFKNFLLDGRFGEEKGTSPLVNERGEINALFVKKILHGSIVNTIDERLIHIISKKAYLNKTPNKPTKMYLIKGDKVTLLDEKTDESGQKWYFINYKGKKELNMWIKAEAVDLEPQAEKIESKPIEKPKAKKPEPVTKTPTNKPAEIAQVTLTTTPKNTVIIKAEKTEPIKTAKGSTSFTLLASMFGLLSLRLKNIV